MTGLMTAGEFFGQFRDWSGELPVGLWYVLATYYRDSSILEVSNFDASLGRVRISSGGSEDHMVLRSRHWASGWQDVLIVRAGTAAHAEAERIADEIVSYPVLDDLDYYRRQLHVVEECWGVLTDEQRLATMRKHEDDFRRLSFAQLWAIAHGSSDYVRVEHVTEWCSIG